MSSEYKPEQVRILFVAETPASMEKHFYAGNTNLYRAIRTAFEEVFGPFKTHADFIAFFLASGCYLDYLCPGGVDRSSTSVRNKSYHHGIPLLLEKLSSCQPKILVVLMKSMAKPVAEAVALSGIHLQDHFVTPFPAHSETNRQGCINSVASAIRIAVSLGIIR